MKVKQLLKERARIHKDDIKLMLILVLTSIFVTIFFK